MSTLDSIKEWLWSIALKKGVQAGLKVVAGALALKLGVLNQFGITVDLNALQTTGLASIVGALEVFRNWLKVKYGLKFV